MQSYHTGGPEQQDAPTNVIEFPWRWEAAWCRRYAAHLTSMARRPDVTPRLRDDLHEKALDLRLRAFRLDPQMRVWIDLDNSGYRDWH